MGNYFIKDVEKHFSTI